MIYPNSLFLLAILQGAGNAGLQHPLPHAHAPPVPMPPHPGLPPGMSGGPGSGLLQLSNAMMGNSGGPHMSGVKDEKDRERERERDRGMETLRLLRCVIFVKN